MKSARREFLQNLIGGAAGISLAPLVSGIAFARPRPDPITVTRLSENLFVLAGAGGNVTVLSGAEGVLMVDGGLAERSADLLKLVSRTVGAARVNVLFNTHWHWENTGSNERLSHGGAKIIAHENTKLWLGTKIWQEWCNRTYPPRSRAALPNETFYKAGKLVFGTEPVEYGYLPQAHTDGDIYVFLPQRNVLIAGDVVSVGSYPILDYSTGGWIGGLVQATQKLIDLSDAQTRIIPGVGPLQTRADLVAEHEMLVKLQEDLWQLMRKGMGVDDMIAAAPTRAFDAQWGNPELFIANAYRGLWGHAGEMGGTV